MTEQDQLSELLGTVETRAGELRGLQQAWRGERQAAWLSQKSRDALDNKLARLGVNYPRLGVNSLSERLRLSGFTHDGGSDSGELASDVWAAWLRSGMASLADLAHTDRLLYGAAYVTAWSSERDELQPVAVLDSPMTATVQTDPATGEPLAGIRTWKARGKAHAVVMTHESITRWTAPSAEHAAHNTYRRAGEAKNPLGVLPMTPLIRRTSADDADSGTSFVADVLDLSDALSKVLGDAMVTSEYFARPRRWATGLEIEEDEDGKPVDPFGESRMLQSEDPETEFGQLPSSRLDGYSDLTSVLTQQIGALLGLPAHYLGLHGDQPPNADSVRAAESQLVATAYSEQRQLSGPWARHAALLHAIAHPADDLQLGRLSAVWNSPEARTPAQSADSAVKLRGIGVPLSELLVNPLGYAPERAREIADAARSEMLQQAATQLGKLRN